MPICKCGCCGETINGLFLPGHDQKLRSKLEKITCGLLNLRDLVKLAQQYSANNISIQQFGDKTKLLIKPR